MYNQKLWEPVHDYGTGSIIHCGHVWFTGLDRIKNRVFYNQHY